MDLDKLAQELGGKPVTDLDSLASQLGGEVAATPGGYGATTLAKDVGKLVTSGAIKGVAGAPETVQAAGSTAARETLFAPTETLNLIADPRRLANKLVGSIGLPPVFEQTKEAPLVPAQVTAKQRAAVDETLAKGKIPQLRQLTEYGNKLSEDIENTISPEMRLAMAESQPTGNIIKALETGDFSEVSMGKNPTALGLTGQAVKVFGTSAPALLTALVTKSAGPATAVGFGQAGAEGIDEARNYIKGMSDEELAKNSEYFRNLVALGYSTNEARMMTEDKAADTASLAQGSVGALGGAFTAKLLQGGFDKTLLGGVKSRLNKILLGTGVAGAEGALTEMAEGVATDLGINKTVVREIGVDSFANLVLGAIGEAAPGVIRGAVAKGEDVKGAEAPEAQPTEAPVTPVTPVEGAPSAIIEEGGFEAPTEVAPEEPSVTPVTPEAVTPAPAAPVEVTEQAPVERKFVEDDAGQKLAYPMFVDMADKGYKVFGFDNPRTYKDKGGNKYRTLEKDGVRIALQGQQLLFTDPAYPNRKPQLGLGNEKDVAFHFIGVDPDLRKQGRARKAIQDLVEVADKNNYTLYGEPAQLEKKGMTREQLTEFYSQFGFKPMDESGRVIVREPGAEAVVPTPEEVTPTPTEVVTEEELPKFSKAENVPVIPEDQTLDSTDPEVLAKFNEIIETYEPQSGKSQEDSFLDAINRDVKSKIETIKAPPFRKGFPPGAKIEVAPFNGGWVGGSSIMNAEGGYYSGASIWDKVYPNKQDAINAEIDRLRNSALTYGNTKAITWLDSIDPRQTKEGKAEINRQRQAEKKAAAETKKVPKPKAKAKPVEEKKPEVKETKEPSVPEIEKAVSKAGEKVDYDKMKKSAENQIDQAIKRTKYKTQEDYKKAKIPEADQFVTIKLPGDGQFKVMNNKERLEEFKRKLTSAIKPKAAGVPRREWESADVAFKSESAFKNFLNEQEPDLAMSIANLTGLDIKKVKLNPTQEKILKGYLAAKKDVDGEPSMESIKSKPGANVARVAKMLGPQLYGSPKDITTVSVKEMVQNSFDAIKAMLEKGEMKKGNITIDMKKANRTIEIKDNGSGMTPDTLANTFLTIAGTKKETEFGSGGFGIAKMLFLFGNKDLEVTTMRDGKIAQMRATGKQLMAALEDPTQAPDIEIFTPEQYGRQLDEDFPDGHGTIVTVTVPETYVDQSNGKTEDIEFDPNPYGHEVLRYSPLFANIDVTVNGDKVYIGSNFFADEYTTFVDAKFKWGTARIYVSKDQEGKYGRNVHVLSNGLWQFSESLKKKPMEMFGDNIPHTFYVDIVSKVKPDEAGYPFNLNRKGLSEEAGKDLGLIKNYIWLNYTKKDLAVTKTSFGNVRYVAKRDGKIQLTENKDLNPESKESEIKEGIDEGSKVEVRDGKLIVNGKEIPVLSQEDLKTATIDLDDLKIPQDSIYPNQIMIHDNLEIKVTDKNFVPISDAARAEFGDRFDSFMYDIGDVFMALRDRVVYLNKTGKLPDYETYGKSRSYDNLAKEAIGISFDKEYRGVSIRLPFDGMFINPAFPEFIDTPETAAYGLFGTMIHELAHFQVRSHNADFPAEMQRLTLHLKSDKDFDITDLENALVDTVKKNKDILDYLNRVGKQNDSRPIGQRFKDGEQQATAGRSAEDVAKSRGEREPGRGVPSDLRPRYQAIKPEPEPEPVPSEIKTTEDLDKLLDKHSRPKAPVHPSHPVKDAFMGGFDKVKNTVRKIQQAPLMAASNMVGKADRALTYQRNKNIFYGTGLEEADRARYGGQVRNGHQQAIASVALTNAIHSGHVATQVMTQGKLVFDTKTQMFRAEKDKFSIANVVRAKAKLVKKLGDQRAAKLIQAFFEAKRSRSIIDEYLNRTAAYENAKDAGVAGEELADLRKELRNIEVAMQKINMTDEAIDDFIKLDEKYPELKEMMQNWTAVNQNMIDMMEFSGLVSKPRAKTLREIKDYVPWYRIMDDQEDVHSAPGGTRGMTNVAREKKFKSGEVDRDIDDIVDNMIHNVLTLTRNSMRNYAANRIVMEYGTRNEKGKLKVFSQEGSDKDGVRFNIIAAGKRIVVQIKDPLVAEAVIGMENIDIPMINALAYLANGLRRSITTFPAFQVAQLFMDAPTAALVTGLKRPDKVWAGVFTSFLKNLRKDDPIVATLRSYGIGGYQSSARTPEKEIQMDIGLIQGSWFSKAMKGLDRFGDASDYAQRRAVYMQTLKETGDELLAVFQANNVIDFQKRGSGQIAQTVTRTVAFMNAYAQSIDVLAKGLAGGGLKGLSRKQAIARMAATGMLLTASTIVYCMLVGDDDEYNKLDDQTKMRNIYIPGLNMRLPMHTGASFFFKAIPELIYNAIMKEGTKDEYDAARLKRALSKSAMDSLLGPNVTPTGVKPVVEIILNRNFFTGGQVTPKGMEDLAAFRQYNQNTSELGKIISSLTGTEKTRVLNPIEADHLMRGLFGTAGAAAMWGTNMLVGNRPEPQAKDNPFYGQFIMPEVARGREDLYYDLKEKTDEAYKTHQDLLKKGRKEEAAEWFKENKDLIRVYGYTSSIETNLKELNAEIRRIADQPEGKMTSKEKRERINELQELKMRTLRDVISMRKRAGL